MGVLWKVGVASQEIVRQAVPILPLSSNVDVSNEPELAGLVEAYAVVEVGDEKIGVVGYTTEDTDILSSSGPNVVLNNIEQSLPDAVADLGRYGRQ